MSRAEQTEIPGTERKVIPAIEEAATLVADDDEEHAKLKVRRVGNRQALVDKMRADGVQLYRYALPDGRFRRVKLKETWTVSVRTEGGPDSDDDDEDDKTEH